MNMLVIEDNPDHWVLIQRAIKQHMPEIKPIWVASPDQALALLELWTLQEGELPQLILLDLYLPGRQDGLSLIQSIKSISTSLKARPMVVLSESETIEDIDQAYQLGIASYVVKPLDYQGWLTCFRELRQYWLETVTLPPLRFMF